MGCHRPRQPGCQPLYMDRTAAGNTVEQASGRTSTTSQWTSAVIFRLQFVQLEGCSGVSSIFVGHRLSTGDEPISLFPVPFEL